MKWRQNKVTENKGILYVQDQVNQQGSIYRNIHQESDVGVDGLIEFVLDEEVTGILIGVQVKSGDSYLNTKRDGFELAVSQDHIDYWANYHLPVYLIFYSPSLQKAACTSIKSYIDYARYHDRLPIKKIEVRLDQAFDSETIATNFPLLVSTFRDEQTLFKCVEDCLSGSIREQKDAFQILAYHPKSRASKVTLYVATKLLMHEDQETAKDALFVLGYGVGRKRWSWNPNNKDEKALIDYACELTRTLTKSQIERIVELVDDEGFHGPEGLGERAFDVFVSIGENAFDVLKQVMRDPKQPMKRRGNCMYLYFSGDFEEIFRCKKDLLDDIYTRKVYIHVMKNIDESEFEEEPQGPTLFD